MKNRWMRWIATAVALSAAACGEAAGPSHREFELEVHTSSDQGKDLAGVGVARAGHSLGTTDGDGRLALRLTGLDGQIIQLSVTCPNGFVNGAKPILVRLLDTRRVGQSAPQAQRVETICDRARRDVVVVVAASGAAGLPIKVNGEYAAETDADGAAHIPLRVDRGVRALEVEIDTSLHRELTPRSPRRIFELSGRDAVLVMQQSLAVAREKASPPRPRSPGRHVPTRID